MPLPLEMERPRTNTKSKCFLIVTMTAEHHCQVVDGWREAKHTAVSWKVPYKEKMSPLKYTETLLPG